MNVRVRSAGSPLPPPASLRSAAVLPPPVTPAPVPRQPSSSRPGIRVQQPSPADSRARSQAGQNAFASLTGLMSVLESLKDAFVLDNSVEPLERIFAAFQGVSWQTAQRTVASLPSLAARGLTLADDPSMITPVRQVNDLLTRTIGALAAEQAGIERLADAAILPPAPLGATLNLATARLIAQHGRSKWQARANLLGRAIVLAEQTKADLRQAIG